VADRGGVGDAGVDDDAASCCGERNRSTGLAGSGARSALIDTGSGAGCTFAALAAPNRRPILSATRCASRPAGAGTCGADAGRDALATDERTARWTDGRVDA
jgi:hypothetical protein